MKKIFIIFTVLFLSFSMAAANNEKKDMKLCDKARAKSTEKVWRNYLNKFPSGICKAEAERALDLLVCKKARKSGKAKEWEKYYAEFPEGQCAAEAKKVLNLN